MRCLVTGAYGFIGQHVARALIEAGWDVVGAGRDIDTGRRVLSGIDWISCDFNEDTDADIWAPRLKGIDALVNCVGILQSTARDDADQIQNHGTVALFKAAAVAGVKRLVHISAISAEEGVGTAYARSRLAAEHALGDLDLNWVIVKPSLVIGPGSYGGTSLLRGLAGLPGLLTVPGDGKMRFQPVAMDDLAKGIAVLLSARRPARTTLYAAGPEPASVADILKEYRRWLGFPEAREIRVPTLMLKPVLLCGDLAGWLGHASALRSTALAQMAYDTLHDPKPFAKATGLQLSALPAALAARPATLQDRLHARSFFLLPALHITIALFWVITGIVTLFDPGHETIRQITARIGLAPDLSDLFVAAAACVDIVLGVLFLLPGWVRRAGTAQIVLSSAYLAALGWFAGELWLDPLGPALKVVPLMVATLLVMACAEKR